jgi:hypothetical protein
LTCLLLTTLTLASAFVPLPAQANDGIEITRANLETTEEGYKLAASFSFELNQGLLDAITRGVPLYFTTEVQLTRPRWYWFDEKTVTASQTIRITHNVLTHQYHAAVSGGLQLSFRSLDDALSLVRQPNRWVVAEKDELKPGEVYNVAMRMGLDVTRLPKPFQVHALNSSDWRFSSDWKRFTFKAE